MSHRGAQGNSNVTLRCCPGAAGRRGHGACGACEFPEVPGTVPRLRRGGAQAPELAAPEVPVTGAGPRERRGNCGRRGTRRTRDPPGPGTRQPGHSQPGPSLHRSRTIPHRRGQDSSQDNSNATWRRLPGRHNAPRPGPVRQLRQARLPRKSRDPRPRTPKTPDPETRARNWVLALT